MSAQRALAIQEILCMVISHFSPENWLDTDELNSDKVSLRQLRRTLADLARVSRAFSGPALCALWAVIEDFEPLLSLLACSQTVAIENDDEDTDDESKPLPEHEVVSQNTMRILCGDISGSDWARFQYYAGLVHVCVYDYDPAIDASVYLQLSLRNDNKPLLPNLRQLKWQQQCCNGVELLHIIGASLRRLEFNYANAPWHVGRARRREYALKALLDNVCNRAPHVEHLDISGVHHPHTLSSLRGWPHLRQLKLDTVVEFAALKILACLKSLTKLCVTITHINSSEKSCNGFEALESLKIAGDADSLEWFFGATHLCQLTSLKVSFVDESFRQFEECRDRLDNLQIQVKYPRLRSLTLLIGQQGNAVSSVLDIIRPLLCMKDLEAFDVNLKCRAHLSDADIEEITRHWKNLRSLKLDHVFTAIEPSIRTLDILARGCPRLEELVLPSVCHEAYIPDIPMAPPHHGLRRIIFYRAMILDRVRFTKYMRQVFPQVVPALPPLFFRRPCEDWCLIVDSFRPVHHF